MSENEAVAPDPAEADTDTAFGPPVEATAAAVEATAAAVEATAAADGTDPGARRPVSAAPDTARAGGDRVGLHRREPADRGPTPDRPRWLPPSLRRVGTTTRVLAGVLVIGLVAVAVVLGTTRSTPEDRAGGGTAADQQTGTESVPPDEPAVPVAEPTGPEGAPAGGEPDSAGEPDAGRQPVGGAGLSNPAALTPYAGPSTIDDGTHVITDRRFTGRLTIRGGDVTIRNSSFNFVDFYHLIVEGGRVTVEQSEFDGMNSTSTDMAIMGGNLVVRHTTFRRFTNAVRLLGNSRVEFNVIDQPNTVATDASTNGIDVWQGSDMTIRHNVINIAGGVRPSGCVSVNTDLTGIDNITIESNDFTGGTHGLQIRAKNGQALTNVRVRDNRWHTPYAFGPHDVDPASAVSEWTGNTLNGDPLQLR
ncbi:hypothetical protein OG792_09660 [Micromonospora sp. NBC_01699]|uniref:right-handed parallel beta-helix repeat-containing protein n=1 Tax=Micromonospora sp. NBC_01699 TaxID=2975984 RepID=UPI002E30E39A|nr:right-handed parallel beta-helix repeat-containing protein [Micromonospora sp. NBC_01699]